MIPYLVIAAFIFSEAALVASIAAQPYPWTPNPFAASRDGK